jgi:hypothetical protein
VYTEVHKNLSTANDNEDAPDIESCKRSILFYMDTKLGGNSTYVTDGAPILSFICNVTDTTTTSGGASGGTNTIRTLKAGKCGPWVGGWETQWDFLYK